MYDPLVDAHISARQPAPNSHWHSIAPTIELPELNQNLTAQVVIIGGGYTGLTCALRCLELGISEVIVLESNTIGWGCSGRNAGFVLPGTGRLSYQELVSRFGIEKTQLLHQDYLAGVNQLKVACDKYHVDTAEMGYLKIAHSEKWYKKLNRTAEYLTKHFDYRVENIDNHQLHSKYVIHNKSFGALRYQNGFGLNPLQLINGYAQDVMALGGKLFGQSPVIDVSKSGNQYKVVTPKGQILTDKVVFATNGYTPKGLVSPLQGAILPVLTSVIVTRPLTDQELELSRFRSKQVMMDTRELKYYYRLLSDNRILFGGRSAISGKEANNPIYPNRLLGELKASFNGLNNVSIDKHWQGWIAVSYDQMPHIYGDGNGQYYATGYCGSGVAFTSIAGKQLGDLVCEQEISTPLYTPLPKFPFSQFRRIGQRAFYQFGRLKDWLT